MDFRLSDERVRFQESVRGFAERHMKDGALERAHEPGFPWDIARPMPTRRAPHWRGSRVMTRNRRQ